MSIHPDVLATISQPRLAAYRSYFKCQSDDEAFGVYMWNSAVCASLMPLMTHLEVSLRNKIHSEISKVVSNPGGEAWFDPNGRHSVVLNKIARSKFDEEMYDSHRVRLPLNADSIVARVSFNAWPEVLASLRKHNAGNLFRSIFQTHPASASGSKSYWNESQNRDAMVKRIRELVKFRNRLMHHEPLWKPIYLGKKIGLPWNQSIVALRSYIDSSLANVLEATCQPTLTCYKNSFAHQWLNRLLTSSAVNHFKDDPFTSHLDIANWPNSPAPLATAPI